MRSFKIQTWNFETKFDDIQENRNVLNTPHYTTAYACMNSDATYHKHNSDFVQLFLYIK